MNITLIPHPRLSVAGAAVRSTMLRLLSMLAVGAGLCAVLAAPDAAHADVPGRVGRLSFMQGDVQSYSEDDPQWKVAYVNQPITSHNSLFVGDSGRAEISVGSTTLALDGGSQVDIQQLDDNTFNANVVRGRVAMRLRRVDPGDQYNVAVPGSVFALLTPGRYRIDALDGASGIAVFAGQASVQADNGPATIAAGNALRVVVDPNDPDGAPRLIAAAPVPVALDDWVVAREERFRESVAQRYVSPNMTGYEDLDANGQWSSEPDVGPVWYPRTYVRADWAPYRYGRWAYVRPWGYTWIDDAPWGFAPFHYGRWLQVGDRWGWCPGTYVQRPVFAPALVGFYGGASFTASFSVGSGPAVGWYPLAPWERFTPYYAHGPSYVTQVNNIVIVNPPSRFGGRADWNRERGATVVPRDAFSSQRSISQVAIAAPRNLMSRGSLVGAGDLPRPLEVPGAVRRGPEPGNGVARPEFRAPRDFARAPEFRGDPRQQTGGPVQGPGPQRGPDTGRPQVGDRRGPDAGRSFEQTGRVPAVLGTPDDRANGVVERPAERAVPAERGPSAPNFNREGRPVVQPAMPQSAARQAPENPAQSSAPNPQPSDRFAPRQQAMQRGDGDAAERARRDSPNVERNSERPVREFRQPQAPAPTPAAQPAARPQPVERPQQFERPQPSERPQQAERVPQVERPQPRVERPAPAPAPAAPPAAAPRPPAPHAEVPKPDGKPTDR